MRRPFPVLLLLTLLAALPVRAQHSPVLVELFTSQGCSACPPADALLTELAGQEGVIALALHVDYWDYLGWRDTFGHSVFTARQKAYAKAARARSIYTPQMIVQGVERVMGTRPDAVVAHIRDHRARPSMVALVLSRHGDRLDVRLAPAGAIGPGVADVSVVRFSPSEVVQIEHGENAGREIVYTNVVTAWDVVTRWDGREPVEFSVEIGDTRGLAVVVQKERLGPVLSAAMLR
jgi:hypothetical protein